MSVLYVAEQGATLHKRGDRLVVQKMGSRIQSLSCHHLEQVIVFGNITITPPARNFLLEQGVDTVFLSLGGRFRGRLISFDGRNIELRRAQFRELERPEVLVDLARRFVRGKLFNCRCLLRRHQRRLQSARVASALHRMGTSLEQLDQRHTVDEIRGLEGAGAAAYFGCFSELLLQPGFGFGGRTRRPPRDPVNAMLSFGYTLLLGTITTAVQTVGLDPFLGSLHAPANGKPSMVLDLMEEFRPLLVDSVTLRAINRRQFTPQDFEYRGQIEVPLDRDPDEEIHQDEYPVLLGRESLKKWIVLYEERLRSTLAYPRFGTQLTLRQICLEQARLLARHLKAEEPYEAFVTR